MTLFRYLSICFAILPVACVLADIPELPMHEQTVSRERADIAAVIRFTAAELAGETTNHPMVTFEPAARSSLRADSFNYALLGIPQFVLMRFVQSENNPELAEVGFVLTYVDALSRRCSVSILLHCEWGTDKIVVRRAKVYPTVSPEPTTLMYVVPADRVPRGLLRDKSHGELLVWLVEHALEEEDLTGKPMPCFIFALAMDRMVNGGRIGLAVDDAQERIPEPAPGSRSLDYEGWPVAVLHGTFNWRSGSHFFVKAVHIPPDGIADAERQLLGVLDNDLRVVVTADAPGWGSGLAVDDLKPLDIGLLAAGLIGVLICLAGYALKRLFWAIGGLIFGACLAAVSLTALGMDPGVVFLGAIVGAGLLVLAVFAIFPLVGRLAWGAAVGGLVGIFVTDIPVDSVNSIVPLAAGHWLNLFDVRKWAPSTIRELYAEGSMVDIAQWLKHMGQELEIFFVLAFVFFAFGIAIQSVTTRSSAEQKTEDKKRKDKADRGYDDYDCDDDDDVGD